MLGVVKFFTFSQASAAHLVRLCMLIRVAEVMFLESLCNPLSMIFRRLLKPFGIVSYEYARQSFYPF